MSVMRRLLPDSFQGRLFLALLGGVLLLQTMNFYAVCIIQHTYARQGEETRAENIASYYLLLDGMTAAQRRGAVEKMSSVRRPEQRIEKVDILTSAPNWPGEVSGAAYDAVLLVRNSLAAEQKDNPVIIARSVELAERMGLYPKKAFVLQTAVSLKDGEWLSVTQPQAVGDRFVIWSQRLFVLLESVILAALVLLFLHWLAKPLRKLAIAVERFGRQPEMATPLPETGVRELREAAQTFNRMRERICGNLAERGRMVAAMAHDLRTPLTRAQLRLGKIEPDDLREQFSANLEEVQCILNQGLELAGSLTTSEEYGVLNLEAFLQSIVDDYVDDGNNVGFKELPSGISRPVTAKVRQLCLKRCVTNIVTNALKYAGNAELSIAIESGKTIVLVEDSGPGIPETLLEQVFEPYYRLENSRNRDTGGTGLGLSIARNMALLNGGELLLRNRPGGGLSAQLILPQECSRPK